MADHAILITDSWSRYRRYKLPAWAKHQRYKRLPLMVVGGMQGCHVRACLVLPTRKAKLPRRHPRSRAAKAATRAGGRAAAQRGALRARAQSINESVYDWNLETDEVYFSPSLRVMLGLAPDQPITREAWADLIHPEDQKRHRETLLAHFRGETKRFESEFRYRAADGRWRWARQHGIARARRATAASAAWSAPPATSPSQGARARAAIGQGRGGRGAALCARARIDQRESLRLGHRHRHGLFRAGPVQDPRADAASTCGRRRTGPTASIPTIGRCSSTRWRSI